MEYVKKLRIISLLCIFLPIALFFYVIFRVNPFYAIALIIVTLLFHLIRRFVFKRESNFFYNQSPDLIPIGYAFGFIFIVTAIMVCVGAIMGNGVSLSLFLVLLPLALFILGFLLIYYSYKTKKEYTLISNVSKVTKKAVKEKRILI